jgi:hypothetical protein
MGNGVGRVCLNIRFGAPELGLTELELSADPNAEGFMSVWGEGTAVQADMDGQTRAAANDHQQ